MAQHQNKDHFPSPLTLFALPCAQFVACYETQESLRCFEANDPFGYNISSRNSYLLLLTLHLLVIHQAPYAKPRQSLVALSYLNYSSAREYPENRQFRRNPRSSQIFQYSLFGRSEE